MRLPVFRELSKKEQFAAQAKQKALEYWRSDPIEDVRRVALTKQLISDYVPIKGKVIDIGAGKRHFECDLALDVAAEVLEGCEEALFPYLSIEDGQFMCAICTDVIAELPEWLHRLALSELARILAPKGYLVCSTALDRKTFDAKECFEKLISTEFQIIARKMMYAPLCFSERLGRMIRGDGGARHLILVAQKRTLH